ncbi:MAG: class I SAM-dependent methyltransferase [Bacteroidales bacterium]
MEIVKNKYNFYEVKKKPSHSELKEYYVKKYYQQNLAAYSKKYTEEELQYIRNKIAQKYFLIKDKINEEESVKLLDVGCGEGHTLKFFKEKGWEVEGLDYSEFGIKTHNPECLDHFSSGDIYENLKKIVNEGHEYDVIWLDNVLEHVLNPLELLRISNTLSASGGVLIVEVPNDFSRLQSMLQNKELIEKDYWIALPDHLSYFNLEGLKNISREANWDLYDCISDYPIEFNLVNPNANYVNDKTKGRGAHLQRVRMVNFMHIVFLSLRPSRFSGRWLKWVSADRLLQYL